MITCKKTDKVFKEKDEGAFYNCIVQDLLVRVEVNQRTKLLLQNWHCFQQCLCVHTKMIEYQDAIKAHSRFKRLSVTGSSHSREVECK
jgi:hypothetical protein